VGKRFGKKKGGGIQTYVWSGAFTSCLRKNRQKGEFLSVKDEKAVRTAKKRKHVRFKTGKRGRPVRCGDAPGSAGTNRKKVVHTDTRVDKWEPFHPGRVEKRQQKNGGGGNLYHVRGNSRRNDFKKGVVPDGYRTSCRNAGQEREILDEKVVKETEGEP